MKSIFLLPLLALPLFSRSQVIENFDDTDLTSNPSWTGTLSHFQVNEEGRLQTNTQAATSSFLTTAYTPDYKQPQEWKFWIKHDFPSSSSNFSKIFLTVNSADPTVDPDGFFLLFGEAGNQDAVRLCKKNKGKDSVICSSSPGLIASKFKLSIRVVRAMDGWWNLYTDTSGTESYQLDGTGFDPSQLTGHYFMIRCSYSISNSKRFYFDNIYVGPEISDTIAPSMVLLQPSSNHEITIFFSERITLLSAVDEKNYQITPKASLQTIRLDSNTAQRVHLLLDSPLKNGQTYSVTSQNIQDTVGNLSPSQTLTFTYLFSETASPGDIVINEIMCDPSPTKGLPEVEYLELYNKSNKYFQLENWQLGDHSKPAILAKKWLEPGQYLLVCSKKSTEYYPEAMGVSNFPFLPNSSGSIVLLSPANTIIDRIDYTDKWYEDPQKKQGGFSLERIKPMLPCSGSYNWKGSDALLGGTPGDVNSTYDPSPDDQPPMIKSIDIDSLPILRLNFTEGMDSSSLVNTKITLKPSAGSIQKIIVHEFPIVLPLKFSEPLIKSQDYRIYLETVKDCSFNLTSVTHSFIIPEKPTEGDLLINEILVDPLPSGSDFVELFNKSNKAVDLFNCLLANQQQNSIANQKIIDTHYVLRPKDYVVFTADTTFMKENYPSTGSNKFIQMKLPSYPIDSGNVYLLLDTLVLDHVPYAKTWHFPLLENTKGKSLERIDPEGNSKAPQNWHTAAQSANFATPTTQNSQFLSFTSQNQISLNTQTISPDNDGYQDYLAATYNLLKSGLVGTFAIYDPMGRKICSVVNNELLGNTGTFIWNGLSENGEKVPVGIYIGYFSTYDISTGATFHKKLPFVVATHL